MSVNLKKIITVFAVVFTALLLLSPVSADDTDKGAVIGSVTLSENCDSVSVSVSISQSFAAENDRLYLFRLPPGNAGRLDGFIPVDSVSTTAENSVFTLPYDRTDKTAPLYSYLIAASDGNGGYTPLGRPEYIDDITMLSERSYPYPQFTSKKGLQVQLTSDAQLLGIKHTVINVSLSDLVSDNSEKADAFIFGSKEYLIDRSALSMLDYRIKTLTDAGIHIYMNLILTFDPSAPESLYYPDAVNTSSTAYALNVSDPSYVNRAAAYIYFLASRYTEETGMYGFCGSYIVGYEVNNQTESNNAGISDKQEYMTACATLLRTADTAARMAYSGARIFTSVSNVWRSENESAETIGAREFLLFLSENCSDVAFGVSIDPYPSLLGMTDYWNDRYAVDSDSTEFLTMKNLNVFTDFLKTNEMLYNGEPRRAMIGEFGLDGKYGTDSEALQAAGYAYAYYTAANNDLIEAFIWHRHVDHYGESGLNYGIYSTSEQLLTPKREKKIHSVIAAVDLVPEQRDEVLSPLLPLLPLSSVEELTGAAGCSSRHIPISGTDVPDPDAVGKKEFLFDFSESTYSFYPSDNSQYLELLEESGQKFLRTRLINIAPVEYMGVGCTLPDMTRLASSDYISVRVRTVSYATAVDFRLIITGTNSDGDILLDCTSTLICNEWTDLYFPIGDAADGIENGKLKLWIRGGSEKDSDLCLDVSYIKLCSSDPSAKAWRIFTTIIIIALIAAVMVFLALILIARAQNKRRRRKRRRSAISRNRQTLRQPQDRASSGIPPAQEDQPPSGLR